MAVAVDVDSTGVEKVLVGTLVEVGPRPAGQARGELGDRPPPEAY